MNVTLERGPCALFKYRVIIRLCSNSPLSSRKTFFCFRFASSASIRINEDEVGFVLCLVAAVAPTEEGTSAPKPAESQVVEAKSSTESDKADDTQVNDAPSEASSGGGPVKDQTLTEDLKDANEKGDTTI